MLNTTMRIVLAAGCATVLAGCEPGTNPDGTPREGGLGGLFTSKTDTPEASEDGLVVYNGEARDIESPDVFEVIDKGLWDGRPSLGGVWVAHPDVKDPERVAMTNTGNGNTVVGALFRRERDNPGPVLQLSSDAARDLGVVPGQPTELRVVALKPAPEPEPTVIPDPKTAVADGAAPQTPEVAQAAAPVEAAATPAPTPEPIVEPDNGGPESGIAPEDIEASILNTVNTAEDALSEIEVAQ